MKRRETVMGKLGVMVLVLGCGDAAQEPATPVATAPDCTAIGRAIHPRPPAFRNRPFSALCYRSPRTRRPRSGR